jgi:hypothetical protein
LTKAAAEPAPPDQLRIEFTDIDVLRRWPKNPKEHDLKFLGESFEEHGFVDPALIDEGTGLMVKGHGRIEKLQEMRDAGEAPPDRVQVRDGKWFAPVIRGVRFKSKAKAGKYLLADNRGTELGGWNNKLLADLLANYKTDPVGTGFSSKDIVRFVSMETGSFLAGFRTGGGAAEDGTSVRTPDGYFTFSLKLLPDQDKRLQEAIKAVKSLTGVKSNLDAIMKMCDNALDAAAARGNGRPQRTKGRRSD